MKLSRVKKRVDKVKLFVFIVGILLIGGSLYLVCYERDKRLFSSDMDSVVKEEEQFSLDAIKENYSEYGRITNNSILYVKEGNKYIKYGTIFGEIEISLDNDYEIVDEYFKLLDSDYYIRYDSFYKIESLSDVSGEYKYYKNYIPYNENVVLSDNSKLFVDDVNYYEVNGGSYAILIKDNDKYGIEFNNRLVYVSNSDVKEIIESVNTTEEIADEISVLNYHFIVDAEEMKSCAQSICIRDDNFDSQIKYLKDNNYYGVSMRDLELFIDGKIQLSKKSVSITIDDGWYVYRGIWVLEKYQMLGTLFLIGSLASPAAYNSQYLEVHSHTWNMHGLETGDDCPNSSFRGGITCFDEETILNDLKQSRESLNNTTYFCYPFYDYNSRAIELLKEAGFTMAFAGQLSDSKVKVGTDKFRIPRYVIYGSTSMNTFISYVS